MGETENEMVAKPEGKLLGHVSCPRCLRRAQVREGRTPSLWRIECPDGHVAVVPREAWKERLDL